jgi:hypothetical protein
MLELPVNRKSGVGEISPSTMGNRLDPTSHTSGFHLRRLRNNHVAFADRSSPIPKHSQEVILPPFAADGNSLRSILLRWTCGTVA